VEQSREKDVVPIPTTIVPVTRTHDEKFKTHSWIKRTVKRILGISMDTRMERIIEYNDWVRDYFKSKGLVVLDLEAPLRISPSNRFLRDDLTKGDGLHLNSKAYKILDGIVIHPWPEKSRIPRLDNNLFVWHKRDVKFHSLSPRSLVPHTLQPFPAPVGLMPYVLSDFPGL
jgi:hypothetical protein